MEGRMTHPVLAQPDPAIMTEVTVHDLTVCTETLVDLIGSYPSAAHVIAQAKEIRESAERLRAVLGAINLIERGVCDE